MIGLHALDWYIEHGRKGVKNFRIWMNIILENCGIALLMASAVKDQCVAKEHDWSPAPKSRYKNRGIPMLACIALLASATARADTLDNFAYTYTLSGTTYTGTFSVVDGTIPGFTPFVYVYRNPELTAIPPRSSIFTSMRATHLQEEWTASLQPVTPPACSTLTTPLRQPSRVEEDPLYPRHLRLIPGLRGLVQQ